MYALKTSTFLRPTSRPSSPAPTPPAVGVIGESVADRTSRPLTKLSIAHFSRKSSPAPSAKTSPTPLIHDGSYLESLSLKLSEAIARALAQPQNGTGVGDVLNGKRPIPAGRGRTLGELIAAELRASDGNNHLQRAILRLLHRPLSVLTTNLSSLLLPLLSSSQFLSPPAPTVQAPNPNPTQAHALAAANFAGELLDCLDELDLDAIHDHRGEGLHAIMDNLVSLINRVANPLIGALKADLLPLIQQLEIVNPAALTSASARSLGSKLGGNQHPSIASLQMLMPIYAKALGRYTGAKCLQSKLAAFLISVVWRALIALSHRPSCPRSRSNSVSAASTVSTMTSSKKRLGFSSTSTPPSTPPPSRFTMKLPGSRPPSPHAIVPTAAADARMLYDLLSLLPKPMPNNDDNRVAREAVDEAFEALAALTALLGAIDSGAEMREDFDLDLLTEGLPTVIALPVLLRWSGHGEPQVIPAMLGISETEYRDGCLSGFGRADDCTYAIAERMLSILRGEAQAADDDAKTKIVVKYLEGSLLH